MAIQKQRKLLTVKEVAEYLHCHEQTVYDLVERKEIPHSRVGRSIRFDLDEVIEHNRQDIQPKVINYQAPIVMVGNQSIKEEKKMRGCSGKPKTGLWNIESGTITTKPTSKGVVRYYGENYKVGMKLQVLKYARNFDEAVLGLNDRYDNVHRAKYGIPQKQKRIKLGEFVEENKVSSGIRIEMVKYFADKWLDDITELDIITYVRKRKKAGAKTNTINNELSELRKTLYLAKRGRYSIDDLIKWGNCMKPPEDRDRILFNEERERLMPELAKHLNPIVICAENTGMRKGEILSLKWKNIVDGEIVLEARNTKTKKQRLIPINDEVQQIFEILKSRNGSEFVFTYGGKRLKDIGNAFSKACKRAGIEDLRFHDLRRTFATRLIKNGVDIYTLKAILGHASITTTMRYVKYQPVNEARAAVQSLVKKTPEFLKDSKMDKDEQFQLPLITSSVS